MLYGLLKLWIAAGLVSAVAACGLDALGSGRGGRGHAISGPGCVTIYEPSRPPYKECWK
jgi:hypothetical protein